MIDESAVAPDPALPGARPSSQRSPLSAAEEQLWYLSQLAPGGRAYNEAVIISKTGPFDLSAFRSAFNEIVSRHEIWRTSFDVVDGEPVRVVHPAPVQEIRLIDLSALPPDELQRSVAAVTAQAAHAPYELTRGPLIRPLLIRFGEHDHRLYLAMHHIVFDGATLRIVAHELVALYEAFAGSQPSPLSDPPTQYSDYVAWEREWMGTPDFARRIDHWQRRLADAPSLQLPLDRPRPSNPSGAGAIEPFRVSAELANSLRSLSRQCHSTLFQVVAAAFAVLLHRYSAQEDVVFGTIADLRHEPQFESMIGYCVTPLVVRVDLAGEPTFVDLVGRLRTDLLNGLANLVPFERLVRELRPHRELGTSPVFQAMLAMQPPTIASAPSWDLRPLEQDLPEAFDRAKFDLSIELDERVGGHIDARLIYNTDIFDAATGRRLVDHLAALLEGIAIDPRTPIAKLPLLSEADRHLQLAEWNATDHEWSPGAAVHDLVSAQAARTPQAVAVVVGEDRLTYAALEQRADQIAHGLRRAGANAGTVVGISVERSTDLVAGLLGILKSGAAYLPLDPRYPPERSSFMLEDSGATVLLTQRHLLADVPPRSIATLCIDDLTADEPAGVAPHRPVSPEDLAYVLYTSGSTGRPKGVRVRHRNVVNLMGALAETPGLSSDDVVLAVATHIFDMSVGDIFPTLGAGARVVLASRDDARDPRRLSRLIEASGATIMHATPVTWKMLVDAGWTGSRRLVAVSGGDTLSDALAGALLDRCAALWNGYGPTETTVYATFSRVSRGTPISIGRPIANVRAYILDRGQQPVPLGVSGELAIGGAGVAGGYADRPDETLERFVADPFLSGEPMYRTGDLARFLPDGSIVHLGRLDRQVKVRGVRIEPGEIEAALVAHPAISSAVVTVREDTAGERRLVAHLVANGAAPSDGELRSWLQRSLPRHMVPAAFVRLEALPVTPSGKVDQAALPAPDDRGVDARADRVMPRNQVEEGIARIWERLLGVARVGVHDDFFDLGGHSLLGVRLLAAIEDEFGVDMPVADFIEGRTSIARQAAFIEAARRVRPRRAEPSRDLLVRAQPHGTRPSLFFVLPSPHAMFIRHYVGPLGEDQPVLGVLGPDQNGSAHRYSGTLEDMVAPRVSAIRAEQPSGPYYLAGYSLGGLLAYGIAGQLRAAGEEVRWLCLLDTSTPAALARFWRRRYLLVARLALRVSPMTAWRTLRDQLRLWRVSMRLNRTQAIDGFDPQAAMQLSVKYRCRGNDAPLVVFATADAIATAQSPSLGWDQVHRGALTIHEVPGDHRALVRPTKEVRIVAEKFAASLSAAQAAG
jgi:amino acid adenylation domain-containing protein